MGKKRIITTQGDTANTTGQQADSSLVQKAPKGPRKQVINGIAHVSVSYNNTLVTITDLKGEVIAWSSAGALGFKGTKKSTPYAANLVARDCFEKARKFNLANVQVVVKGVGPGREAAMRGLAGSGLNIVSIMDATPIAHNGVRRKKPRRV